jgi:hypothetical protein
MVRNTYIYPPEPSMRIISDISPIRREMPKFNSHLDLRLSHAGSRGDAGAGAGLHHRRRHGICAYGVASGPRYRQVCRPPELLLRHRHELLHGSGQAARGARAVAPGDDQARRAGRTLQDAAHPLPDLGRLAAPSRTPTTTSSAPRSRRWRRCWAAPSRSTPMRSTKRLRCRPISRAHRPQHPDRDPGRDRHVQCRRSAGRQLLYRER